MPLTLKNFYALVPLNPISDLTVVGGDTEATITWTDPVDLASTTWVSTKLVRKVGSAPVDSTDGTLVVTETVRDTYSVSGYNDTGLTNGTTYYYAAFAVGNNGLETISSTTPSVTPAQGGWQPGANTTLYLPLNGDLTDPYNNVTYSWNGTSSYATWDTGIQAANFTGSNAVALGTSKDFINGTGECTVLFWFTTTSPSTEQRCAFNVSGKYFIINRILNGKLAGQVYTSSNEYTVSGTTSIVANTKYLAAITRKENGKMCVYLNGNLEGQTNISGTFKSLPYQFGQYIGTGRTANGDFWRGMIKDFIIENRERTAQEILAYYNLTK